MARALHDIRIGEELEVKHEGRWYPCHVKEQPKPGEKIHVFIRWGDSTPSKKIVSRTDLRRRKK